MKNPLMASLWQFEPGEPDPQVEAMTAALAVRRTDDDRILVSARGKVRNRWEKGDSVWLELTDTQALMLIERVAAALQS